MEDDVKQSGQDRYALSQAYRWKAERDKAMQELRQLKEEVEGRIMPEGMEWPKYGTGGLVSIGDDVVGPDYGERIHVDEITFHANGFTLREKTGFDHWYESDDRFERTVLAADGKPLLNGDEVWRVKGGGGPYHVQEVRDGVSVCVGETHCEFRPDELTHRAPVLAADGEPLEVGQTVWSANTGEELEVVGFDGDYVKCRYDGAAPGIPVHGSWHPRELTHQRPVLDAGGVPIREGDTVYSVEDGTEYEVTGVDGAFEIRVKDESMDVGVWAAPCGFTHAKPEFPDSWERIEADCMQDAKDYCEEHGIEPEYPKHIGKAKCEDLVRRARALAGGA